MAFPFSIRPPSPSPTPRSAQGQIPNKPAPQKTSTFGYSSAKKTIAKDKPGFLEKGMFRGSSTLRTEVRKGSYYKGIPTYSKKFTATERANLITELEKSGRGMGGLTGEKLGAAIKKMEKIKREAKSQIRSHADSEKVKILDQKIKQAQVWKKTWDRPKI